MPVSVIEAMALGLPVISTNVGGIPYLVKDQVNGVLVEPDNELEMVKAIVSLMANHLERDVMIANARQHVSQFDWENVKKLWFYVIQLNNC